MLPLYIEDVVKATTSWPSPTSCKGSCPYDHAIRSYFDDEALE
jgi:hypothetical protein